MAKLRCHRSRTAGARVHTIIEPTPVRGLGSGRSVRSPTRCVVGNAVGSASPQDRSPSAEAVPPEPDLGSTNVAQDLNLQRELCGLVSKRQILRFQSLDQIAVLMPFPAVRIRYRLPSIRQAVASHPPHFYSPYRNRRRSALWANKTFSHRQPHEAVDNESGIGLTCEPRATTQRAKQTRDPHCTITSCNTDERYRYSERSSRGSIHVGNRGCFGREIPSLASSNWTRAARYHCRPVNPLLAFSSNRF
jgi:hypothetical protein